MDKFRAIEVFVAIADRGSLTGAARHLNLSLPTIVRTLANLERGLRTTLFNRTTRKIALTDEGRRYLDSCRASLAQLAAGELALKERRTTPSGRITVTASVMFGRMHVMPLVNAFLRRYPDVSIELLLLDRVVDLIEEGIDVAFRIGSLPDSTLHGRPLGQVRRVVCAGPAYLKRRGVPAHPADLHEHDVIVFRGLAPATQLQFVAAGRPLNITVVPRISTNSIDAALTACADGLGVAQFLSYMVEPQLRNRSLRKILQEFEPPAVPVSIVYPHSRALSTCIRAFVDQATDRLKSGLAAA